MKKLAFISDLIFTFFVSFLFTACFFRFLRVKPLLALLLSAVCGGLTTCAMAALLNARRKKFFLKKKDAENKDKLLVHLALLPASQLTDYFLEYFNKTEQETPTRRHKNLQLSVGDKRYFLRFHFHPVTADDVADIFRVKTNQTKILLCTNIDAQAKMLCEKLHIQTHGIEEVYTAFKEANILPQTYLGATENKKRRLKPQFWFAKSNARRYLTSAAMLILLAQLTPFFYYYLIFSVLLLLTAILVRIFGYDTAAQN